jgi:endonuclease VIII-like 1
MPEGPELCYMGEHVARLAQDRVFTHISRSEVAVHPRKHPEIPIPASWKLLRIRAESRGKEMRIVITRAIKEEQDGHAGEIKARGGRAKKATAAVRVKVEEEIAEDVPARTRAPRRGRGQGAAKRKAGDEVGEDERMQVVADESKPITLLVRAGMTGNFIYKAPGEEFRKHAHLRFHDTEGGAICFEDSRRFGSWQVTDEWGPPEERGPCILKERDEFRAHIARSLELAAFAKPVCEVMLDQRFFNGMGNYLRAEVLHRAGVHPFLSARSVFAHHLQEAQADAPRNIFSVIDTVFNESLAILRQFGFDGDEERLGAFYGWLTCYLKLDSDKDGLGRTIW